MIFKVLLTLAILIAVYIWFRTKNGQRLYSANSNNSRLANDGKVSNKWIKPFSYSMAGLVIAAGMLIYYLSWQEDHTQYQVTITNPQTGSSETYIVLKKDMYGRKFITEGGLQVNASQLERIEIKRIETN
jgi:hypothetical protein